MRTVVVALLCLAGCKQKATDNTPAASGSGSGSAAPAIDWPSCEAAVAKAGTAPLADRPQILLDGCRVCGDWTPLLRWSTPPDRGGPSQAAIETAMLGCNAFCVGDAKMKFLGTLEDARSTGSRMPWKQLGLLCRERVSAVPDDRYVDAPYFALDRIARAVSAHGGPLATSMAALDLPLPAIGLVGNGPPLPVVQAGVSAAGSELQITVLGGTISVGTMPRARLGASGVAVDLGSDGYPGKTVTLEELGPALKVLAKPAMTVSILAPHATPAEALVQIVAVAAPILPVYLAARAPASPGDWELPGSIPIALEAGDALRVTADMTVQQLADELAKRVGERASRVGIRGP